MSFEVRRIASEEYCVSNTCPNSRDSLKLVGDHIHGYL
jgi:hypothetical protein